MFFYIYFITVKKDTQEIFSSIIVFNKYTHKIAVILIVYPFQLMYM
jgi:hypothetical protein